MTLSSCVQPVGRPRRYLNAIWMRKAANIAASIAAATFSARAASQAPIFAMFGICRGSGSSPATAALHRVDLVEHALGPALGEIRGEILLLRELAEGLD